MALDFEWNGNRWIARKAKRKRAWHEHRGVAHYDKERMRQPLGPMTHSREFEGYASPPSWIALPETWGAWDKETPANYFHGGPVNQVPQSSSDEGAQTTDYVLESCYVETVCTSHDSQGQPIQRTVVYRWRLTFSDGATFRFFSRAVALAALAELQKIRKAKHPRLKFGQHSSVAPFFTDRKLAKLPAEYDQPLERSA